MNANLIHTWLGRCHSLYLIETAKMNNVDPEA